MVVFVSVPFDHVTTGTVLVLTTDCATCTSSPALDLERLRPNSEPATQTENVIMPFFSIFTQKKRVAIFVLFSLNNIILLLLISFKNKKVPRVANINHAQSASVCHKRFM